MIETICQMISSQLVAQHEMANLHYFTTLRKVGSRSKVTFTFLYVAIQSCVKFNENKAPESCGPFVNPRKAR